MAILIYNIVKKTTPSPFLRIILTPTPTPPPPPLKIPLLPIPYITNSHLANNNPTPTDNVKPTTKTLLLQQFYYPSFPFGCCSNPIPTTGFHFHPMKAVEADDGTTLWADSVKKKRKRKMNKHKYRKRMKLLRRRSRNKS